jgi:predicted aldo/keto reductase-like oxidoreductase
MQYRRFGKLDWEVSVLGFGVMRLPLLDEDDSSQVDEAEATRIVRYAIDHGVNYVDTAYTYHDEKGEPALGRILKDGYRERVKLATKLPTWLVKESDDFDRYLTEQLERLQTDYIDFYLLHALRDPTWPNMRRLNVFDWAEKAMAEGRIHHLGFSFHDQYDVFQDIIDAYDGWTMCQIQYNLMDVDYQAGTRGLQYAADKGLAVVVMEPLRGGRLARNVPPAVQSIWDGAPHRRTPADWALQWVWSQPEVAVALSGMSSFDDVEQNLASADASHAGLLTEEELALVSRVRETYHELCPIPCTDCRYCMPCPSGVNIPRIFELYNDAQMYDAVEWGKLLYGLLSEENQGNACTECGECMEVCPQQIEIPDWLAKAHALLGS